MATYTVRNSSGNVLERGLTSVEAMCTILEHDGFKYEIRSDQDGWWALYHSEGSRNSYKGLGRMVRTKAICKASDEAEAERLLAEIVINAGWDNLPEAITDEAYDKELAELASEVED